MKDFNQLFTEAFEYFQQKNFFASLMVLEKAGFLLLQNPVDELICSVENLKGFNNLAINDNITARLCFEKALNINQKSSQACAGLGEIFFLENKDNEAKAMYEWAVVNDPKNQFAISGLAKVNLVLGLDAKDNTLYEEQDQEQELIPSGNFKEMVVTAGKLFEEKNYGQVVNLVSDAEEKIREEIDNLTQLLAEIGNMKGFAQMNLNDINSARESFETTLNLQPDSSQACVGLGEIFFKNQKISEAKAMFEWGVKNDPSSLMAQSFLAKANFELGYPQYHNALTT